MAKIKVKYGGCGIKYTDAHGAERHALKTPEHGPFECDDAQAARLVALGVAEYVGTVKAVDEVPAPQTEGQQEETETSQDPGEPAQEPEKATGHLDEAQLQEMTIKQLKALAADMGVDVSDCDRKNEYVAAIAAVEVEIDDVDDPDNDLPDLSVADPE